MKEETLYLYLNQELDPQELAEVEEWIKENPRRFREIKSLWEKTAMDPSQIKPDTDKMWGNIMAGVEQTNSRKERKLPVYKTFLKYAAIFILGFGIIGFIAHREVNRVKWIEYTAEYNTPEDVVLPDGSEVALNKGSKLYYKKQLLSHTRDVKLTGEAFFEVQKNPNKPFVINVNNTVVKVLGTSFNVNATDTNNIMVSVKTGKVLFYNKQDPTDSVHLYPGDMGLFSSVEDRIRKTEIHDQNYLAWKTGVLLFKGNTLPEVCEVLSNYYGKHVVVGHPELQAKKLTARYQDKSLNEVLELLKIALDIQYEVKEGSILLTCK